MTDEETEQEKPMPLHYNELKARLKGQVSDDIVRLLSTSYEALADFAQITTQADVNSFNQKYQVELVLPHTGGVMARIQNRSFIKSLIDASMDKKVLDKEKEDLDLVSNPISWMRFDPFLGPLIMNAEKVDKIDVEQDLLPNQRDAALEIQKGIVWWYKTSKVYSRICYNWY